MTILIVCTGNTCRSPMAEGMLRALLSERFGPGVIRILSAGTAAIPGEPAADHAITVLEEKGIDLKEHKSQALTEDMIREAELILAMTDRHREAVLVMVHEAEGIIRVLAMEDPFGLSLDVYRECAAQLEKQLLELAGEFEKEDGVEGRKKNNGEE